MAEWIARCRARLHFSGRSWVWEAAEAALGLLFSGAGASVAPLGAAVAAACWIHGGTGAFFGALAGALLFRSYAQALCVLLLCVGAGLLRALDKPCKSADKLLLLCAAWGLTFPVFYLSGPAAFLDGVCALSLSALCAICFTGALRGCKRLAECPHELDQLCMAGAAALLVCACGRYALPGFRLSVFLAGFFALLAARARGVLAVAAAALFGAGCVLGGAELAVTGALCLCALAAAALRDNKWGMGAAFLASALLSYRFVSPAFSLWEAGAAAALYLCLPASLLARIHFEAPDRALAQAQANLAVLRQEIANTADVLKQAAPLFESADGFAEREALAVSQALTRLSQEERPPRRRFEVQVGAAALPKAGSKQTGDSMGMREIRAQLLLLLSDGMGSGEQAHRESAAAVALLGDLLRVGFELPEALECVNRMLIGRAIARTTDMFATMDALLLDLSDGSAQFIKYGAPPSYILREGKVHTLYAEALPAGIVKEARPALHKMTLRRGDAVVLMTDGAFDALGSDLTRALLEKVGGANTVHDAAESLLLCAREKSGADDMTVLVARIA